MDIDQRGTTEEVEECMRRERRVEGRIQREIEIDEVEEVEEWRDERRVMDTEEIRALLDEVSRL